VVVRTRSPEETRAVGERLARDATPGDLVVLTGPLGAGKTVFAQGFARGLGVRRAATSPSFVLVHTMQGRLPLHHADLWRLERPEEVDDLALGELLADGVVLIEWGERADGLARGDHLGVSIEVEEELVGEDRPRRVRLRPIGAAWTRRVEAFRAAAVQDGLEVVDPDGVDR
jgi:tRNA threonylcarbamoyladenosine biosynthesis protein TsaE